MKDLIEYIAKCLVDKPEEVRVTEVMSEEWVTLRLEVAPDDMGKVIGKQGRIARAIRTLLKVVAVKEGTRVALEIGNDAEAPGTGAR